MEVKNKKKIIILTGTIALMLLLGVGIFRIKRYRNKKMPPQTIILKKKDIINGISASGIVVSDEKVNVYTNVNTPIAKVLVSVGDKVKKGDALAVLDISGLEKELEETKLNYKGSSESLKEIDKENKNNIINTNTSLEGSRIALSQQELQTQNTEEIFKELKLENQFDSKALDHTINELKLTVSNKEEGLKKLLKQEEKLKKRLNKFDDSDFKEEDLEKSIVLKRKKSELIDLEKEIEKAKRKPIVFEDYIYKNLIEDAKRDYKKKLKEISKAGNIFEILKSEYRKVISKPDVLDEEKNNASRKVEEQRESIDILNSGLDDLSLNVKRTEKNLKNAESEFYRNNKDLKTAGIDNLEKDYRQIKHEIEDLEREYGNLTNKLNKAKKKQLEISLNEYESVQTNIKDMEYELSLLINNHKKALMDKEKTIEEHINNHEKELRLANKNLLDSKKQLETSHNNLESFQNALKQARDKNIPTATNEINKLNVERLESKIKNGKIVSTSDGVVTEVKAEVGAIPTEIIFVIEDMENIHIKAKVKEHNLELISLGQKANITTVASGDEVFHGKVSYIAPRAIIENVSPSVEFEIFTKPININSKIKLGMNAFLNIITESKKNVFVVPLNAVVKEGSDSYIHTIEGQKILVDLGISTKSEVEIKSKLLKEKLEIKIDMDELYTGETSNEGK